MSSRLACPCRNPGDRVDQTLEGARASGDHDRVAVGDGSEFDDTAQNSEQAGDYLAVEPGERVALPWRFPFSPKATTVEYRLEGSGDTTLVSFAHTGFERGEPWDSARARFGPGWRAFLEALKHWVEGRTPSRPLGIRGSDGSG